MTDTVEEQKDEKKVEIAVNLSAGNIRVQLKTTSPVDETEESLGNLLDLLVANSTRISDKADEIAKKIPESKMMVPTSIPAAEDPMTLVAMKLNTTKDDLKKIIGIEGNSTQIICGASRFSSGEAGALLLLYSFQFGLNKQPSHNELSDAYSKSGFEPSFGARAKGNLKQNDRITISKNGQIAITPKGVRDVEEEFKSVLGKLG